MNWLKKEVIQKIHSEERCYKVFDSMLKRFLSPAAIKKIYKKYLFRVIMLKMIFNCFKKIKKKHKIAKISYF